MVFLRKRGDIQCVHWNSHNGKKQGESAGMKKAVARQYLKKSESRLPQRKLGQTTNISLRRLRDEYLSYSESTKKQSACERHITPRIERFVEFLQEQGHSALSS
ncbi:MAG: hypothetical protein ACOC7T_01910 [Planctomycetota bacterium]